MRNLLNFLALLPLVAGVATAQFAVSPTRVLLDGRARSSVVNVTNTSTSVLEVTTDVGFKLIRSDEHGNVTLDTAATPSELERSCREWLRVYPRRFTLAPGATRPVRVLVEAPGGVGDGEYWGRLMVAGTAVSGASITANDTSNGITTSISPRLLLDMPVIYRAGIVETGITLKGLRAERSPSGGLNLVVDLARGGNSAYRGTLSATIADESGTTVASVSEQFTAEFSLSKLLPMGSIPDGFYAVTLESRSEKKGSAIDAVIPAPTVNRTGRLSVKGNIIDIQM